MHKTRRKGPEVNAHVRLAASCSSRKMEEETVANAFRKPIGPSAPAYRGEKFWRNKTRIRTYKVKEEDEATGCVARRLPGVQSDKKVEESASRGKKHAKERARARGDAIRTGHQ